MPTNPLLSRQGRVKVTETPWLPVVVFRCQRQYRHDRAWTGSFRVIRQWSKTQPSPSTTPTRNLGWIEVQGSRVDQIHIVTGVLGV